MNIKLLDKRLTNFEPATKASAGYDLKACIENDVFIQPGETLKIQTGISLDLLSEETEPYNQDVLPCAFILPRSGLGCRGVVPRNSPGLIDADYQGEIVVCLYNGGTEPINIKPLDRIAQLVFSFSYHPYFDYVEEFSKTTERGENGFGSTGMK